MLSFMDHMRKGFVSRPRPFPGRRLPSSGPGRPHSAAACLATWRPHPAQPFCSPAPAFRGARLPPFHPFVGMSVNAAARPVLRLAHLAPLINLVTPWGLLKVGTPSPQDRQLLPAYYTELFFPLQQMGTRRAWRLSSELFTWGSYLSCRRL